MLPEESTGGLEGPSSEVSALSPYALTMRCPLLALRMVLPQYCPATWSYLGVFYAMPGTAIPFISLT